MNEISVCPDEALLKVTGFRIGPCGGSDGSPAMAVELSANMSLISVSPLLFAATSGRSIRSSGVVPFEWGANRTNCRQLLHRARYAVGEVSGV